MAAPRIEKHQAVLVVDDEPGLCWALMRILRGMGLETAVAANGRDALHIAKHASLRLAFVDVKIPDMDGIDLARRLRGIQPRLPVVLLSGYFYEEDSQVQAALKEGLIRGFISKPFRIGQIREAVAFSIPSISVAPCQNDMESTPHRECLP